MALRNAQRGTVAEGNLMLSVTVISVGAPHHAEIFTKHLQNLKGFKVQFAPYSKEYGYSYVDWKTVDVLWAHGLYATTEYVLEKAKEENPQLKVVCMWLGSDWIEKAALFHARPKCVGCVFKDVDVHASDGKVVQAALKQLDVTAHFVPSIPMEVMSLTPLPKEFKVAAYVQPYRKDFYQYERILAAAKIMKDTPFHVFGGGPITLEPDPSVPNLHYMGFVEGEEKRKWWNACSVVIYIPLNGNIGVTAMEFLQAGRYAIVNESEPYTLWCKSLNELVATLKKLKQTRKRNIKGSRWYTEHHSPVALATAVKNVLGMVV